MTHNTKRLSWFTVALLLCLFAGVVSLLLPRSFGAAQAEFDSSDKCN
jgi:cbb3-type cytochrome oxidase subunit 3